jgi:hypothetical protein
MALQSDGSISIADVAVEFGGDAPHGFNEYYDVATGLPVSGTIGLAHFYGTTAIPLGPILGTWAYNSVIWNPNAVGTNASDLFGQFLDTDGTHFIAVATQEDRGGEAEIGQAYIFDVATGNLLHTLANPDTILTDAERHHNKVAIHGSYAIWAVPYNDSYAGTVYIYDVATGNVLHTLVEPSAYVGNTFFGYDVALNDTHIAITSIGPKAVHIYNLSTGVLERTIADPNVDGGTGNDSFGNQVVMNSTHVLTSAPGAAVVGGVVYLHKISDGSLTHSFANPNTAYGGPLTDGFGWSTNGIDMSETHVIIGAVSDTNSQTPGNYNKGSIYIYDLASPANPLYSIVNPNLRGSTTQDLFGYAVAINGAYAVATSPYDRNSEAQNTRWTGAVYVFELSTGNLVQSFIDPNPNTAYSGGFAEQISMTDLHLLISSHAAGNIIEYGAAGYPGPVYRSGKVYSYTLTPN